MVAENLLGMKIIRNTDTSSQHYNFELQNKIHDKLLNSEPKQSREDFVAEIMEAE